MSKPSLSRSSSRPSSILRQASTLSAGNDSFTQLTTQLQQVQDNYKRQQTQGAVSMADATSGAIQQRGKKQQPGAMTHGEIYNRKRRELSSLTLDLIMTLRMNQIVSLRNAFEKHGGTVNVAQFVAIMCAHIESSKDIKAKPDLLLRSLVELFDSMDLDGDGELEFEELLTTVVHMGLAATEHLLLSPISLYRPGPSYLLSMHNHDRFVGYVPERDALMVVDSAHFAFRLFDPTMSSCFSVHVPGLSSILGFEYVTGVEVDRIAMGNQATSRLTATGRSSTTREKEREREEKEEERKEEERERLARLRRGNRASGAGRNQELSMWDKLASMPLSKPMRMENGQLVLDDLPPSSNASNKLAAGSQSNTAAKESSSEVVDPDEEDEWEGIATSTSKPRRKPASALFGEYVAKPYYGTQSSTHGFTSGGYSGNSSGSNATPTPTHLPSSGKHGSSTRTPLIFIQEDFLITSTSQLLQIWSGFPTGPATLADSKPIRCSYSTIKWCRAVQKLFCGDVEGRIHVWRISIVPKESPAAPPSKPQLIKERELVGHTDIITGLESISSMGFLLSSSLDASVRMFDLQSGTEKNRFIGHRAGVVAVAYSTEYRFLLSAGSDHVVCVWSPFAESQVYTLRGHTAPLISVQFVPGTPQILSGDSSGEIRVWDARNFTCCQVMSLPAKFGSGVLTSLTAANRRTGRIYAVGKCHELMIFEQEGGPFLKRRAESSLISALYSPFTMTLLTANKTHVYVWDGLTGCLSRVYRGLAEAELSAVSLDARQRKLFVADQQGKIRCYNYLTGAYMKSLTPHTEEIIQLLYSGSRRLLISATDRTVFVHDERPIEEQILQMTIDSVPGTEFLCVALNEVVGLLACASSSGQIELWNLDQSMREGTIVGNAAPRRTIQTRAGESMRGGHGSGDGSSPSIDSSDDANLPPSARVRGHSDVITSLLFLDSTPYTLPRALPVATPGPSVRPSRLLVSGDESGSLMFWFTKPSKWKGQLAFGLSTSSDVTNMEFLNPDTGTVIKAEVVGQNAGIDWEEAQRQIEQNKKEMEEGNGDGRLQRRLSDGTLVPASTQPPSSSSSANTSLVPADANVDPIKLVTGMNNVPGITCMAFHAPSSSLFCGHRNGRIVVWQLKHLLDFLRNMSLDPAANWFGEVRPMPSNANQLNAEHSHHRGTNSHGSFGVGSSPRSPSFPIGPSNTLALPSPTASPSSRSPSPRMNFRRMPTLSAVAAASNAARSNSMPLRDQIALIAETTKPARIIKAHQTVVQSLHIISDPPSLLSITTDHLTYIWSLDGKLLGKLDPIQGLARGYALSAGDKDAEKSVPAPAWQFHIDVGARERADRRMTTQVMSSLQVMAQTAAEEETRKKEEQREKEEAKARVANMAKERERMQREQKEQREMIAKRRIEQARLQMEALSMAPISSSSANNDSASTSSASEEKQQMGADPHAAARAESTDSMLLSSSTNAASTTTLPPLSGSTSNSPNQTTRGTATGIGAVSAAHSRSPSRNSTLPPALNGKSHQPITASRPSSSTSVLSSSSSSRLPTQSNRTNSKVASDSPSVSARSTSKA